MILPANLRARIIAHARQAAPAEACGILAGRDGRVSRAYPLPNVSDAPLARYLADPEAQLRSFRDMERRGQDMLAVYHSHPRSEAAPSPSDIELAYYPEARHVIVSLAGRRPAIRCYMIAEGTVTEEALDSGHLPALPAGPK